MDLCLIGKRGTPTYHICGQPLFNVLHDASLGGGDLEEGNSEASRSSSLGAEKEAE